MKTLRFLVHIANTRWMKALLVGVWLLSLLWMVNRGWVWESWQALPSGGIEHQQNYFDIRRNSLFVWSTLVLVAYLAHWFRQRSLGYYGFVEVLFGVMGGYIALEQQSLDQTTSWLAVLASAYIVVRGAGNISQAVKEADRGEA